MDELDTFDGWRKHHGYDVERLTKEQIRIWRDQFENDKARRAAARSAVFFNQPVPYGEYRYAVAIEDGADLRLALAVSRRPKKRGYECVILMQRDGDWNPHATYHQDGTYHHKSFDQKWMAQKRQPLDKFRGTEHLGSFMGLGTGAAPICNPANFTAVLTVPQGILESTSGIVLIDLVEPDVLPNQLHRQSPGLRIAHDRAYSDCSPWVVIAVAAQTDFRTLIAAAPR
jgi:hypothetical protein